MSRRIKPRCRPYILNIYPIRTRVPKYTRTVWLTNGLFSPTHELIATDKKGVALVPQAFIPRDKATLCLSCKKLRSLMVIHCEHCDAPLPGFEGVPRTNSDNVAKHGADCFCEECVTAAVQSKQEEEQKSMDFGNKQQQRKPQGNSRDFGNGGSNVRVRRDFLKGVHLPADGRKVTATVEGFREAPPNMQFSQYLVDITLGGKPFCIGLKGEDDTKLERLISVLGPKTDRWAGKKIQLHSDVWNSPTGKVKVVRVVGK